MYPSAAAPQKFLAFRPLLQAASMTSGRIRSGPLSVGVGVDVSAGAGSKVGVSVGVGGGGDGVEVGVGE